MGRDYWQPLLDFISDTMLAEGTISAADVDRVFVTDSPRAAVEHILDNAPLPHVARMRSR